MKILTCALLLFLVSLPGRGQTVLTTQDEHLLVLLFLAPDSGYVKLLNVGEQDLALHDIRRFVCRAQSYAKEDSSMHVLINFTYGSVVDRPLFWGDFVPVVLQPDSSLTFSLPPSIDFMLARETCRKMTVIAWVHFIVLDAYPHPCVPLCTGKYFVQHETPLSIYYDHGQPWADQERLPVVPFYREFSLQLKAAK